MCCVFGHSARFKEEVKIKGVDIRGGEDYNSGPVPGFRDASESINGK